MRDKFINFACYKQDVENVRKRLCFSQGGCSQADDKGESEADNPKMQVFEEKVM